MAGAGEYGPLGKRKKRSNGKDGLGNSMQSKSLEERLTSYQERLRIAESSELELPAPSIPVLELLIFSLGQQQYAIEVDGLASVIESGPISRVPKSPRFVLGVISVRGAIVTVIDVRSRLGHPFVPAGADTRILVLRDTEGYVAFEVDHVSRVMKIHPGDLRGSEGGGRETAFVRGEIRSGEMVFMLLDSAKLLQVSLEVEQGAGDAESSAARQDTPAKFRSER